MNHDNRIKQGLILIVALSALLCLPWLERPFHTRGEPREALVAQAMLSTGNWISPPAYDGAVPSKPPFSHWLIALTSLPGGEVTEATSRLPSALAMIAFSGAFFIFLANRLSLEIALTTSLILLSSSEWFRGASTCRVDTILATSMAGAILALYVWWERNYRGIPWLALILISSAALTKGPIGIVLPVALFSFFCWQQDSCRMNKLLPVAARAVAISLPVVLVVSIWYLLGYLERGDAFLEKIRYENFERFTSSMADEPHKHSALYLVGMLALGVLPWTLPLMLWATVATRERKIHFSNLTGRVLSYWKTLAPLYRLSWIVSVGVFLFFCVPSSKRSVYLLPMYPCTALLLEGLLRKTAGNWPGFFKGYTRAIFAMCILLLASALILNVVAVGGISLDPKALLASFGLIKLLSVALIACLVYYFSARVSTAAFSKPVERLAGMVLLAIVSVSFFIYDGVAWQLSPKSWLKDPKLTAALNNQPTPKLFSFGSEAYGASFYLNRPFSRATPGNVPAGSLIFLEARKLTELNQTIAQETEVVGRYSSGLESPKKDVVVVRVGG